MLGGPVTLQRDTLLDQASAHDRDARSTRYAAKWWPAGDVCSGCTRMGLEPATSSIDSGASSTDLCTSLGLIPSGTTGIRLVSCVRPVPLLFVLLSSRSLRMDRGAWLGDAMSAKRANGSAPCDRIRHTHAPSVFPHTPGGQSRDSRNGSAQRILVRWKPYRVSWLLCGRGMAGISPPSLTIRPPPPGVCSWFNKSTPFSLLPA